MQDGRRTERSVRRSRAGLLEAGLQVPARALAARRPRRPRTPTQAFFAEAFEKSWFDRFDPGEGAVPHLRAAVRRSAGHERAAGGGTGQARRRGRASEHRFRRRRARAAGPGRGRARKPTTSSSGSSCGRCSIAPFARCATTACRGDASCTGSCSSATTSRPSRAPAYAELAAEFALTSGQVTGYLAQARRAFRTHAIADLQALCGSAEEFRREARDLLGVEVE